MRAFILSLTLAYIAGLGYACPAKCTCTEEMMQCIEKGLTRIPSDIPSTIEKIELQRNNITHITRDDFAGIEHLRILYLSENQISNIEKNSFAENTQLEILRLNHNELTILPELLFSKLKNLQRLDLSFNKIAIIQKKTLRGPTVLRTLQLNNNEITCLHDSSLRPVRTLEFLTLDNNKLSTLSPMSFLHMSKLRTFRFNENPIHCDCHLAWMAEWLRARPSAGLYTQCVEPTALRGMEIKHLERSEFVCNVLTSRSRPTCELDSYCPSVCTCDNGIVDCRDKGLTSLPASLPSDVTEIRLERNMIKVLPSRAFADYKKLRRIDLSNNMITDVSKDAFQGLKQLNSLIMYGNKISDLHKGTFDGLVNLQLLLLNANKIMCLRHDSFDSLTSLKLLSLYDNKIQSISKGTFKSLKSVQTLHLAQNPFICDCNLRWLADYLQENPVETSGARCAAPRKLSNKKIAQIRSRKFKCDADNGFPPPLAGECTPESECPDRCKCDGTIVDCSSQELTGIPDNIPPYVTDLILSFNNIDTLVRVDVFKKMTNLKKIDLSNNKLTKIEKGAFNGASSVLELWINDNELKELKGEMFSGLDNLKTLMARNNRLSCINNETFSGLSSLSHLSLYGNKISSIVEGAFDSLSSLTLLNLLSNPLNCNCHMAWLSVWLRQGTFSSGNPRCSQPSFLHGFPVADINPQDFRCTSQERSDPPTCKPEVKCPQHCSCEGNIVRCINSGLTSFPVDDIPEDVTELYLNLNMIRMIPPEIKKFTKLVKLDLSNNQIATLQDYIFSNFTQLSTLLLAYNKLRCIPPKGFVGLRNLRILSLHSNEISTVADGTFDDLVSLSHTGFGSNPWYCDCNLAWFNEWINEDYLEPGIAQCSGPPPVAGMVLLTTPISKFVCADTQSKCKRRSTRRRGPLSLPIASKCDPCLSTPCLHNGTCRFHPMEYYQCICPPGFKGKHCEMPVNACNLKPCLNGASCRGRDEISYTCTCPAGFSGMNCEQNINDCLPSPCRAENATCIDGVNSYKCRCPPGWSGEYCDIEVEDPCISKTCLNGGECVTVFGSESKISYRCDCKPGFRGQNCSEEFDPCLNHKCENAGRCVWDETSLSGYRCECPTRTRGQYCEFRHGETTLIQQDDPCHNHDCKNGAQCFVEAGGSSDFTCKCLPGYSGVKCEILSGVSIRRNGSFIQLPTTLDGMEEIHINLEISTKEMNGVIMYASKSAQHLALELFTGYVRLSCNGINSYSSAVINDEEFHEIEVDITASDITLTVDGVQTHGAPSTRLISVTSYLFLGGMPADVLIGARQSWHIRNTTSFIGCIRNVIVGGKPVNFFTARQGEHEDLFSQDVGIKPGCSADGEASSCYKCLHGDCTYSEESGFTCSCFKGYTGPACDITDEPQTTPCSNNQCHHGSCRVDSSSSNSYICDCDAGYSGSICDIRDYCAGVDCGQHGTCVTAASGYICKCKRGYTGRHCERRIRRCKGTKTRQFVQITIPRPSASGISSSSSSMMCKSSRKMSNLVCDGSNCSRRRKSAARRRSKSSQATMTSPFSFSDQEEPVATCCVPLRQKTKSVELVCDDGSRIMQEVTKVQSCGCQTCL